MSVKKRREGIPKVGKMIPDVGELSAGAPDKTQKLNRMRESVTKTLRQTLRLVNLCNNTQAFMGSGKTRHDRTRVRNKKPDAASERPAGGRLVPFRAAASVRKHTAPAMSTVNPDITAEIDRKYIIIRPKYQRNF